MRVMTHVLLKAIVNSFAKKCTKQFGKEMSDKIGQLWSEAIKDNDDLFETERYRLNPRLPFESPVGIYPWNGLTNENEQEQEEGLE